VENIMKILQLNPKGSYMDIIEKFHTYKETISDRQLNDKDAVTPNKIFETVIKNETLNNTCLNTPPLLPSEQYAESAISIKT
jgi:hypothetical protein